MLASVIGTCYLAALAMMDALRREVAVWILWVGSAAALISATILLAGGKASWPELIFGAVPGLLMLAVAGFTKEAGPGDGIVLLQMNVFLLLNRVIFAFGMSLVIMGAFSAVLLLLRKGKKDTRLPYLPFLWLGSLGAICLCG